MGAPGLGDGDPEVFIGDNWVWGFFYLSHDTSSWVAKKGVLGMMAWLGTGKVHCDDYAFRTA